MDDKSTEKSLHRCIWFGKCEECECVDNCDDFYPVDDTDFSDAELAEYKYQYRSEFFKYAEEIELFD